ncbi:MAG TPA: anthranilate synthase component I family protein [Jatrophihabitans sp.]|nr:anthranilate synthase component I family protein [Jatrophihabitans sp.]
MTATITHERTVAVRSRRLPAGRADPLTTYLRLAERFGRDGVFLLESVAGPRADTRYSLVGFHPLLEVSVRRGLVRLRGVPGLVALVERRAGGLLNRIGDELALLDRNHMWDVLRAVQDCFDSAGSAEEFRFGFLAFFGYDTARYIEKLPLLIEQEPELPDLSLVLHQGHVRIGPDGAAEVVVHSAAAWPDLPVEDLLGGGWLPETASEPSPVPSPVPISDSVSPDRYRTTVLRCLEHVAAGDIYQVQVGHELTMRSDLDPVEAYRRLRERNPSPYMYLAPLAGHLVVGASPELFARVERGVVTMRPIAGTLPCEPAGARVEDAARRLRQDPKEIAEHVMLVDLCRNDIGRICATGTLDVPQLLAVERYSRLLHLVSTVEGRVADGLDAYNVIAALFPSGTMTGAPKVRAMEIIEAVETTRRGLYAGALGLIDVGGYLNLALCIRTLVHRDGVYRARASAGIVADSVPDREWAETVAKLGAARWAVCGEEAPACGS